MSGVWRKVNCLYKEANDLPSLQVVGIFAGFGVLLLVASPFLLLAAPCILCCKCKICRCCEEDEDSLPTWLASRMKNVYGNSGSAKKCCIKSMYFYASRIEDLGTFSYCIPPTKLWGCTGFTKSVIITTTLTLHVLMLDVFPWYEVDLFWL